MLGSSDAGFYLHVDDGLISVDDRTDGPGEKRVYQLVHRAAGGLEDEGFAVKGRGEHGGVDRVAGREIGSSSARARAPRRRAALLSGAED